MKKLKLFYILILTIMSGYINTYTLVNYAYTSSHLTGNLSNLALNIRLGNGEKFLVLATIILVFCLGSFFTGLIFNRGKNNLFMYSYVLVFFSLVLVILAFLPLGSMLILYGLALIAGMQNALPISYAGLGIRTTHMTGYITDLGWELADLVKVRKKDGTKARLFIISIAFFILGSYMAAFSASGTSKINLYMMALVYFLLGLVTFIKLRVLIDRR